MHYGQMKLSLPGRALRLGLHPSTLAGLTTITSSFTKGSSRQRRERVVIDWATLLCCTEEGPE